MRLSKLRALILIITLGVLTVWITNQQSTSSKTEETSKPVDLGYSWQATQTTIWNISPLEKDKQTILEAQRILYKDTEKKSEYLQPTVQLIDKETNITLTSKTGESIEDTVLYFKNDVVITQVNTTNTSEHNNKTTLQTDQIHYNLQTNQLATDAKVVITQYNGQTIGTGLKANLKTSELELLSDVSGTYYPQTMQKTIQAKEP